MIDIALLTKIYEEALEAEDFNVITEVIRKLNQEGRKVGKDALTLYEKINQDLFNRGSRIGILDLKTFRNRINEDNRELTRRIGGDSAEKSSSSPASAEASSSSDHKVEDTAPTSTINELGTTTSPREATTAIQSTSDRFKDTFIEFYNRHPEIFSRLKDYYLFQLANEDAQGKPEIIIVCEGESGNNSLIHKLHEREQILATRVTKLDDFIAAQRSNPERPDANYICLLCLTPKLGNESLRNKLGEFFEIFSEARSLTVTSRKDVITKEDVNDVPVDENHKTLIDRNCNKVFSNRNLSFDEQLIIKKFFREPGIIDYRVIAAGMSGAIVIEVQFMQFRMRDSKRFVIKIGKLAPGVQNKLKREHQTFQDNVELFSSTTGTYGARYESTDVLEAIQYNFASSDSLSDSFSFSKLIDDFINVKRDVEKQEAAFERLRDSLTKLLGCELFNNWNVLNPTIDQKPEELYQRYLAFDDTVEEIREIINADPLETPLVKNFQIIKDYELKTKTKTCHGDLHSQNFFYDGTSVYLIDFGWTGRHHALIDHAFLEASIRLNHFPRFIPVDELAEYDAEFMNIESFNEGFKLDTVRRKKLARLYELISLIRIDAKKYMHNPDNPLEYLIALFMISFRLIQFSDLHQLYALEVATQLSERIVELISSD